MDGFRCWKIHRAVSLHLTSLKYDMVEQRGNVKGATLEKFSKLNARYIFENVARNLKTPNDAVHFFIANIIYSNTDDVYDAIKSWDNYALWTKNKEMTTQLILDDLETFQFQDLQGNPPKLLVDLVSGNKNIHTAVAINRLYLFIDRWIDDEYFTFIKKCIIIKKLDKFVKFNGSKIALVLSEKENETV